MSLKKFELDRLVQELHSLQGSQIQRIAQPSPEELLFQIRCPGETLFLLISIEPGNERLHLVAKKPPSLPSPPIFCMTLRKYIRNARIQSIIASDNDKIVQCHLKRGEDECYLLIELLPRKSNIFLCNSTLEITHHMRPIPQGRELKKGQVYEPPPPPTYKLKPPPIYIDNKPTTEDISKNRYAQCTFHQEIADRYEEKSQKSRLKRIKQEALKQRKKTLKKLKRLCSNLDKDLHRCEETLKKESDAELLKGALHEVKRGQEQIEVIDYYHPELAKKVIALDPKLSPQANLQKLFQRIKRAKKGLGSIRPRLEDAQNQSDDLELEIMEIEEITDLETLLAFLPSGAAEGKHSSKRQKQQDALPPYNEYTSKDGQRIWVGRNSKCNDELTFKIAKGNDLWLHARGYPGSHVVIPLQKGRTPSQETLLDAASLAAHFSKAKDQTHIEIITTERKYVKKPKGAPPGQVSIIRDKNLTLRIEKERLERLFSKKA